jgi:hypothetical protein
MSLNEITKKLLRGISCKSCSYYRHGVRRDIKHPYCGYGENTTKRNKKLMLCDNYLEQNATETYNYQWAEEWKKAIDEEILSKIEKVLEKSKKVSDV